jgi:hypothetical protein
MSNNLNPIAVIDAIFGQLGSDERVTAYQIWQLANTALELLERDLLRAPQPIYNMTKAARVAAEALTGAQAMDLTTAKAFVVRLVTRAGATSSKLDTAALKANAIAALKATK